MVIAISRFFGLYATKQNVGRSVARVKPRILVQEPRDFTDFAETPGSISLATSFIFHKNLQGSAKIGIVIGSMCLHNGSSLCSVFL